MSRMRRAPPVMPLQPGPRRARPARRGALLVCAAGLGTVALLLATFRGAGRRGRVPRGMGWGNLSDAEDGAWQALPQPRWKACAGRTPDISRRREEEGEGHRRYVMIQLAGGLNQMRAGICDAVVVAALLEASLVFPMLDNASWWADGSRFEDIFDAEHFAASVAKHGVTVVTSLPRDLRGISPTVKTVPRHSEPGFYERKGRLLFRRGPVILLKHFDSRLADALPLHLEQALLKRFLRLGQHCPVPPLPTFVQLRCHANYEALRFRENVVSAAQYLIEAMQLSAAAQAGQAGARSAERGRYVALHLRYEPDMLAFTGCDYGGSDEAKQQLAQLRKRWPNLPRMDPAVQMAKGKCVVSPSQVALALHSLGLGRSTPVYVASGALYGGPAALAPLRAAFPSLFSKEALAQMDLAVRSDALSSLHHHPGRAALQNVLGRATLMAAVDYEVCRAADLFVANNNGNMATLLTGHRRYMGQRDAVRLVGSSVQTLLSGAEARDEQAHERIKEKLLHASMESNRTQLAEEGFFAFPRGCLCEEHTLRVSNRRTYRRIRL